MQPVNCVPMPMLCDLCKLNYQCCLMPDVRHLWGNVSTLWRVCVNVVSVRRDVNYCESLRSSQTSITWAFWSTALHAGSPSSGSWNVYSQYPALSAYFASQDDKLGRVKRVCDRFKDPYTKLTLLFLQFVLPVLMEFVNSINTGRTNYRNRSVSFV